MIMIECIVRRYLKTKCGQCVRLERICNFQQIPFISSQIDLKIDVGTVIDVIFVDGGLSVILLDDITVPVEELSDEVLESSRQGWGVKSHIKP